MRIRNYFEYGGQRGGDEPENTLPSPCRDDLSLRGQGRKHAPFYPCGLFVEQGGRALHICCLQFVALVTLSISDCCAQLPWAESYWFRDIVSRAIISNLLASYRWKKRSATLEGCGSSPYQQRKTKETEQVSKERKTGSHVQRSVRLQPICGRPAFPAGEGI